MQFLDKTGVGTLWSMCKTKFALKDHSHNYLPLSGGTLTGDLLFSNSGTTFRQIRGTCGDNDFWRIGGGATGNNAGYMEIATADDGTEPIYVRQYSGTFNTITRTATLLDGSGNTSFPGTVAAAKFKGALEGNASTASNASTVNGYTVNANVPSNAKFTDTNTWRGIQDNLTSTSTSDSLSANQGRILKGLIDSKANSNEVIKSVSVQLYGDTHSGFTPTIVVTDNANQKQALSIDKANGSINGLMSFKDKSKLDGIAYGANNYSLPTASAATLGGIKVSRNAPGNSWPICVDGNGLAETKIGGLVRGDDNSIAGIVIQDSYANTYYSTSSISVNPLADENGVELIYPLKRGTFALLSDIPDVSNLCRFNFVNSISECKSDRINFFLGCTDYIINLDPFDAYPDGTILIISISVNSTQVRHNSGRWFCDGDEVSTGYTENIYKEGIKLVTKYAGMVYFYSI